MKRHTRKGLTVAATIMLAGGLLAACGGNNNEENRPSAASASGASQTASTAGTSAQSIAISYYTALNANASAVVTSLSDVEMYKELQKRTGVAVNFKHPAVGQEKEQFNLLIASGNLTDVIETAWNDYPGGPSKALADGTIVKLNDLIAQNAPNLSKLMKENEAVDKMVRTDTGDIYMMPMINLGKYRSFDGPFFRKDWLDELGLKTPKTIGDWENTLRAFKEKKGATAPFTATAKKLKEFTMLPGAFGVSHGYYLDGGKVKYGPAQDGYKQYIALMNKWFKEGLLDPDTFANDTKKMESNLTSGKSGLIFGYIGGTMGTLTTSVRQTDPKFELVGAQYPVLNDGDKPQFVKRDPEVNASGQVGITKANAHPAETVKWLDTLYGEDGALLKNFGVEGLTYTMGNGKPTYTDLIMKNPDKLSPAQAMAKYFRANYPSPGLADDRYIEQYYTLPEQQEAAKTFAEYADLSLEHVLPPVTLTPEESEELAQIEGEVNTYLDEMTAKFIMGVEPIDNYDKFVSQLQKMKIDRAVELKQAAYDRYAKR
ncbi:putative aldouronate transport system substrate-binding protein [Cohnella sp. OV330]|uniref:extracellular solute-binding protein n=1 Tax=Cohnella sp. OV330 TaxID=1855288 RepID=UPI0008E7EBC8|nr:extracellular solute-binding protein [Cohnella sp. OV330]SFA74316.1 putative aldouronate transport system substrate-binding protein [Cohnella sp. OV330]